MKLAIMGAGKMGGAIMTGALAAGRLQAADIGIFEPYIPRAQELAQNYGVRILAKEDIAQAQYVLIAVKPQMFLEVAPLLKGHNQTYISIMAGVNSTTMSEHLASNKVIRLMPNLGAAVAQSATALCAMPEVSEEAITFTSELFSAIGKVYPLSEKLIDAFTGLAGSGPAFVALFAEALADGAVRMGLPRDLAKSMAQQTLLGAATLLENKDPAQLKDEVCSAGGTSIAGVRALEEHGLRFATMQAVEAATLKALELGKTNS